MINLVVCTHGNSGIEMLNSAEMICGKQENTEAFGFMEGENIEELHQKFKESFDKFGNDHETIVMLDLQGGTPFNVAYNFLNTSDEIVLIAGVNIPMLIEFFVSRNSLGINELLEKVIDTGKNSIIKFDTIENTSEEDNEF